MYLFSISINPKIITNRSLLLFDVLLFPSVYELSVQLIMLRAPVKPNTKVKQVRGVGSCHQHPEAYGLGGVFYMLCVLCCVLRVFHVFRVLRVICYDKICVVRCELCVVCSVLCVAYLPCLPCVACYVL